MSQETLIMSTIQSEHFTEALRMLLDEAFDNVHGIFLDKGTSFFETLADISAAEASIPVGGKCATLAAQVKHVAFYLDVTDQTVRNPNTPRVDWGEIWRTVSAVTPAEWDAIRAELRAAYNRILALIDDTKEWPNARYVGGGIAIIVHTAYHLGEVRQALCTLRP
jgi:hypothetical protein